MNPANGVSLLPVSVVAERAKVEIRTVTKWIRENKLPGRKSGKFWMVRSDVLAIFIKYGNQMPPDYPAFDNKIPFEFEDLFKPTDPSTGEEVDGLSWEKGEVPDRKDWDVIICHEALEKGKTGWTIPHNPKLPNEMKSRLATILNVCPQYKNSYGNFTRDAFEARLRDIEYLMKVKGRKELDEKWESWKISQRVIQEKNDNEYILDHMLRAAKIVRSSKNKKEWEKFVREQMEIVDTKLTGRWKKFGKDILSGKLVRQAMKQEEEESLWA